MTYRGGGQGEVRRDQTGFTMLEILAAVAIKGILAGAMTGFMPPTSSRAKQSEAMQISRQIYTMRRAYHREHATYACDGVTANLDGDAVTHVILRGRGIRV